MKLTKYLLAAASATALTAGVAHAQSLSLGDIDADPGDSSFESAVRLAEEVDWSQFGGSFFFEVNLALTAIVPGDDTIIIGARLDGGALFGTALTGANIEAGLDAQPSDSAFILSGGAATDSEVTWLVNSFGTSPSGEDQFGILLPIDVECPVNLTNIDVWIQTELGNPIDGTSSANPLVLPASSIVSCVDAYSVVFNDSSADWVVENDDNFTDLGIPFDTYTTSDNDQITSIDIGIVRLAVDTSAIIDPTGTFASENPDIASVSFDVVFPAGSNFLTDVYIDTTASTSCSSPIGNASTCTLSSDADLTDILSNTDILMDVNGVTTIPSQQISVANAVINFDNFAKAVNPPPFFASEDQPGADIEYLDYQGLACGYYDWFRDGQGAVNHIIRVTGLPTGADIGYAVQLVNSTTPGANGTYIGTLTQGSIGAGRVANGEGRVTGSVVNALVQAASGLDFGTADARFTFFVDNDVSDNNGTDTPLNSWTGLDCDRLISTQGVVGDYGDDANSDGSGDFIEDANDPDDDAGQVGPVSGNP